MNEISPCRHEFVIMFQRRWTQLGRRLAGRRAYLPVGFKTSDLSYLGEQAYCFCVKCRARLHPKLTRAEKEAARLAKKAQKVVHDDAGTETVQPVQVEELELEDTGIELVQPLNVEDEEETPEE